MSNGSDHRDQDLELHDVNGSAFRHPMPAHMSATDSSLRRAHQQHDKRVQPGLPNGGSAIASSEQNARLGEPDRPPTENDLPPPSHLNVTEQSAPSNRTVRYALARIKHSSRIVLTPAKCIGECCGESMFSSVANRLILSLVVLTV